MHPSVIFLCFWPCFRARLCRRSFRLLTWVRLRSWRFGRELPGWGSFFDDGFMLCFEAAKASAASAAASALSACVAARSASYSACAAAYLLSSSRSLACHDGLLHAGPGYRSGGVCLGVRGWE